MTSITYTLQPRPAEYNVECCNKVTQFTISMIFIGSGSGDMAVKYDINLRLSDALMAGLPRLHVYGTSWASIPMDIFSTFASNIENGDRCHLLLPHHTDSGEVYDITFTPDDAYTDVGYICIGTLSTSKPTTNTSIIKVNKTVMMSVLQEIHQKVIDLAIEYYGNTFDTGRGADSGKEIST